MFKVYERTILWLIFIATSSETNAVEVPAIGSCPRVNVIRNFDLTRFFGRWYEICAYPNKLTFGGRCVYSTFAWTQNNGITIFSKHISLGKEKQFLGTAKVVSDGVLGVTYPAYPKANAYYNVLDTDYENFAVIFSCNNYYGLVNGQNLWIVSRRKNLEQPYVDRAMAVLNSNGLNRMYLKHTDQTCMERQTK